MQNSQPSRLTREETYEFENYIRSFTTASDRVRHVLMVSLVASILVFAAYRNSGGPPLDGWLPHRIELARLVANEGLIQGGEKKVQDCFATTKSFEHCERLQDALTWFRESGHGEKSFERVLGELEKARVSDMQIVKVPFLGIEFDINDLGTFSAIGLSIIGIVLCYSMARHHENLYLCLWKVRRIGEHEARYSDGQSKANFLYHSLAMAQVFSRPPTLARWGRHRPSRIAPAVLFLVPVIVQGLVFYSDLATRDKGKLISSFLTNTTMGLHVFFGLILGCFHSGYNYVFSCLGTTLADHVL